MGARGTTSAAVVAVVAMAVAPQAAMAAPVDVLRDCADDNALSGSYSRAELQGALQSMPGDLDEYSNCRAVIGAALAAGGPGPGSPPAGGGPDGPGGEAPPPASGGDGGDGGDDDPVGGIASRNERGGAGRDGAAGSGGRGRAGGGGKAGQGPDGDAGGDDGTDAHREALEQALPGQDSAGGGAGDVPGATTFLKAARTVGEAPPLLLLLAAVGCLAIIGALAERRRA